MKYTGEELPIRILRLLNGERGYIAVRELKSIPECERREIGGNRCYGGRGYTGKAAVCQGCSIGALTAIDHVARHLKVEDGL